MPDLKLDRAKTAVLCMDVHNLTLGRVPENQRERLLATIRRVLDAARQAGVLVVYVAIGRRADFSSPRNKFTGRAASPASPVEQAERLKIPDRVAPLDNDPIVRKPRMNAFYGSELQTMLAARDVDTLVLTGIATNFVVESTARYAADADYRVIVLEDGCAAASEEEHERAIASMEPLVHIARADDFLASVR